MLFLKQFLIIIAVSFCGEILKWLIPLPIAASVYGIVLMFLCLQFKIIKVRDVKETSAFLIEIMPILFLPAAVGLLESWGLLQSNWAAYVTITVATTFLVMIAAGWCTQWMLRRKGKGGVSHG